MRLLCLGDVALAGRDMNGCQLLSPISSSMDKEDRILFNWELPIGVKTNPIPRSKGVRILANPDALRAIRGWSPGFATLATNHILDAGKEGLSITIESLNQAGFMTVGAGQTSEEIARPLLWETAEGRLAIINWVFAETDPDWMSAPGPNCWPGIEVAGETIRDLKSKADWVMVVAHWSDELFPYPRSEDRLVAHELVRAGANIVLGHHPHVVRGMETINSCPVFYSVGNYYFSDIADAQGRWVTRAAPRNREGLGIQFSFKRGAKPEYLPLSFWQGPNTVLPDSKNRAARRMELVGRPLRQFEGYSYKEWYSIRRVRFERWQYRLYFGLWRLGLGGSFLHALKKLNNCLKTKVPSE